MKAARLLLVLLLALPAAAVPLPRHVRSFYPSALDPGAEEARHYITGMGTDSAGNVYVVDTESLRVAKISPTGDVLLQIRSSPQLSRPADVAVDAGGFIYVTDTARYKVVKFDAAGSFVREWGQFGPGVPVYGVPANDFDFNAPASIAISPDGRVFVSDSFNGRLKVYTADGAHLATMPLALSVFDILTPARAGVFTLVRGGRMAAWQYALHEQQDGFYDPGYAGFYSSNHGSNAPAPADMASIDGVLLSAGETGVTMQRLTPGGTFPQLNIPGMFLPPRAMAAGPQRTLYVSDGYSIALMQWDEALDISDPAWSPEPPASIHARGGQPVEISVQATGTAPITYEWSALYYPPPTFAPVASLVQSGASHSLEIFSPPTGTTQDYQVIVRGKCGNLSRVITVSGEAAETAEYPARRAVFAGTGIHLKLTGSNVFNPVRDTGTSAASIAPRDLNSSWPQPPTYSFSQISSEWLQARAGGTSAGARLTCEAGGTRPDDDHHPTSIGDEALEETGVSYSLSSLHDTLTLTTAASDPVQLYARARLTWHAARPAQIPGKPLLTRALVSVFNVAPTITNSNVERPIHLVGPGQVPYFQHDWAGDPATGADTPPPAGVVMLDIPLGTFTPGQPGTIGAGLWTQVSAQTAGDYSTSAGLCLARLHARNAGGSDVPLTSLSSISGTAYYTGAASAEYDAWRLAQFASATSPQGNPAADPDNDGANNTAEFFFHMNPLVPDAVPLLPGTGTSGMPLIRMEGSAANRRLSIEYIAPADCGAALLESSADCANWTGTGQMILSTTLAAPGWVRIKAYDPLNTTTAGPRRFLRMKVEL